MNMTNLAYVVRDSVDNPTWTALNDGLAGTDLNIRHLTISNPHAQRAYVCTENYGQAGGNMFRNDLIGDGAPWEHLTLPAAGAYPWAANLRVNCLCADPTERDTIYAVVNYYLHHRSEVDAYLAESDAIAVRERTEAESILDPTGIRARLMARRPQRAN